MRAYGYAKLGREKEDRDVLVDSSDPGSVELQYVQRAGGEHLFEHDAVGDVLAGRDEHWRDPVPNLCVAEDVVGARRFFDPQRPELGQLAHPVDRLTNLPTLIGVDANVDVRPHARPGNAHPANVFLDITPNLELDHSEAALDRLFRQPLKLGVVVAEPARTCRVRRVAFLAEQVRSTGCAGFGGSQEP